jgi:hypothetical protein
MTISVQDLLFQEETDSGRKWEKVDTKKKNIKIMFTSSTHVPSPPVNSYSHFCGAGMTICHFRGVLARSCDLGKLNNQPADSAIATTATGAAVYAETLQESLFICF